uniref:RNA helicase n=1 Tax=Panagrellus redivivus TaxID=6233 RepID=A0A7E5A1I3_PANRE
MPRETIALFLQSANSGIRVICSHRSNPLSCSFAASYETESIENAARAFAKAVPPATISAVYIIVEASSADTKRIEPALKAVGFANVSLLNYDSLSASVAIDSANITCEVGEFLVYLFTTFDLEAGFILQKLQNGYKFVKMSYNVPYAIAKYPALKHVILDDVDKCGTIRNECRSLYPGKECHFVTFDPIAEYWKYLWNKFDNGNFGGNLVEEAINVDLVFKFSNFCVPFVLRGMPFPLTTAFQLDIAEASKLDVYVKHNATGVPLFFKTFNFKGKKDRVLNVTVAVGLDQAVDVSVDTVGPVVASAPMPLADGKVGLKLTTLTSAYQYSIHSKTGTTTSPTFNSIDAMVTDVRRKVPPKSVHFIFYSFKPTLTDEMQIDAHQARKQLIKYGYPCLNFTDSLRPMASQMFFGYKDCDAIDEFDNYDVKTVVSIIDEREENTFTDFGDRNVIVGCTRATFKRYQNLYYQNVFNHDDLDGYMVYDFSNVDFTVSWCGNSIELSTGFVTPPYDWTIELDLGNACRLQIIASYPLCPEGDAGKVFKVKEIGSSKVALTFSVKSEFEADVNCVALSPGRILEPISLCLLIERTAKGFRKTVYFRDSDKAIVDHCPNMFVALEPFKQAKYTAIFFDATNSTVAERQTWNAEATKYGFKAVKFVNGPVLMLNSVLLGVDSNNFGDKETVLIADTTAVDKAGQKTPLTYVLRSHQKKLKLQKVIPAKIDKVYSTYSVDRVFVVVDEASKRPKVPAYLNPVFLQVSNQFISKHLFSQIDMNSDTEAVVDHITGTAFVAEWKGSNQVFNIEFENVPFSRHVAIHVGEVKSLRIKTTHLNSKQRELLKEFSFKTPYDRVVMLNIAADEKLQFTNTKDDTDEAKSSRL